MNVENDVETKGTNYQSASPTVGKVQKLVNINKIQT